MVASNDSAYQGIVRFPNDSLDHGDPLDTGHVKDGLVNTLEQLYNGASQVRVNAVYRSPLKKSIDNPPSDETGYRLLTTFEFPLTMLKDGTPAPVYVEINGAALGAVGVGAFATVSLQLRYRGSSILDRRGTTAFGRVAFSSTSLAWYTATNLGDGGKYLRIPDSRPPSPAILKTRNHPDESRPAWDVEVIEAALDVYAYLDPGADATGVSFGGIFVRESPWNEY